MSDITQHPIMGKQCKCSLIMAEHGHDCHPMWREHHGLMEGWRYLDENEPLADGDEHNWEEPIGGYGLNYDWRPSVLEVGTSQAPNLIYRRRIAPIPEAPKRFVTVVVKMTDVHALDRIKAVSVVEEIREGNYLEKFDGMEQNVIEAMRKGKVV